MGGIPSVVYQLGVGWVMVCPDLDPNYQKSACGHAGGLYQIYERFGPAQGPTTASLKYASDAFPLEIGILQRKTTIIL